MQFFIVSSFTTKTFRRKGYRTKETIVTSCSNLVRDINKEIIIKVQNNVEIIKHSVYVVSKTLIPSTV